MKPAWTLADILDIEFFFKRDESLLEQGDDSNVKERDRSIFIAAQLPAKPEPDARTLAHHWLTAQRREHQQQVLPGQIWKETTTLSAVLWFIFSLLFGIGLAASFLRYDGTTPVNVSGFFAMFVLVQLLLVLLQLGLFGYRLVRRVDLPSPVLYALVTRALTRLLTSLFKRSQKQLGATRRLDLQALSGSLRQLKKIYGNLLLWPAFILLQLGGLGFNLGVILTLLAKVSFTDIAFGWQSTLPLTDLFLAELVRWIALPWSWLMPDTLAYPNLDQVIGSKIVLIEDTWRLTTAGLTSWWPFLVCGVSVYGLLPRLLLLGWGSYRLSTRLKKLPFNSAEFRQLRRRMLTPLVQTDAEHQIAPLIARPPAPTRQNSPPPTSLSGSGRLVLIPDELLDICTIEILAPQLQHLDNCGPLLPLGYGSIDQSGADLLEEIADTLKEKGLAGIILIQEAWQPPIREVTTLLTDLRHSVGQFSPLTVALIGKPSADNQLTPIKPQDLKIWLKTIRALADPYLDAFPLVNN